MKEGTKRSIVRWLHIVLAVPLDQIWSVTRAICQTVVVSLDGK